MEQVRVGLSQPSIYGGYGDWATGSGGGAAAGDGGGGAELKGSYPL